MVPGQSISHVGNFFFYLLFDSKLVQPCIKPEIRFLFVVDSYNKRVQWSNLARSMKLSLYIFSIYVGYFFMVTQCEECKYNIGNKCWHYGKMNPGQQWEKIVWGCEKYCHWGMMRPLSLAHQMG